MLKQPSCKRALLLVAAMTATLLAVPSLASASSWGPIGTTHVLDSTDLEFTFHTGSSSIGVLCTEAQLHVDVISSADVTITNLGFPQDCHGIDLAAGCTVTPKALRLHWTMTAPATDNIMIHGIHINWAYENKPPPATSCPLLGLVLTTTGTVRGGIWDPAEHEITFKKPSATGLSTSSNTGGAPLPTTMSGTFRDTTQTLTLT
ncbi:MAG TPA: hypothetical protein VFY45_11990 [Baekduia sp.]|nr:hypothetical protein [Baekduia sp.]